MQTLEGPNSIRLKVGFQSDEFVKFLCTVFSAKFLFQLFPSLCITVMTIWRLYHILKFVY